MCLGAFAGLISAAGDTDLEADDLYTVSWLLHYVLEPQRELLLLLVSMDMIRLLCWPMESCDTTVAVAADIFQGKDWAKEWIENAR